MRITDFADLIINMPFENQAFDVKNKYCNLNMEIV